MTFNTIMKSDLERASESFVPIPTSYRDQVDALAARAEHTSRLGKLGLKVAVAFALIFAIGCYAAKSYEAAPQIKTLDVPAAVTKKLESAAQLAASRQVPDATASRTSSIGGSNSNEFDGAIVKMMGLMEGTLGKVMALAIMGFGLALGLIRQSVFYVVNAISFALFICYGPVVLRSITGIESSTTANAEIRESPPVNVSTLADAYLSDGKYGDFLGLVKRNNAATATETAYMEAQVAAMQKNAAEVAKNLKLVCASVQKDLASGCLNEVDGLQRPTLLNLELAANRGAPISTAARQVIEAKRASSRDTLLTSQAGLNGATALAILASLALGFSAHLRRRIRRVAELGGW